MSNIFVKPFESVIGTIFIWLLGIIKNHGITLIFLSLVVNIILFPFYHLAEKIEKKEKDIQKKMKPKIDEFKSVYEGYELHLYIKNVYRLNNYHPIYSLRGLISLLIQIPFFMGAYAYLSKYPGFKGVSFLNLKNLAEADGLIRLGILSINFLPFLMTFINLASGYVYSKDMEISEKITIIVIALFFLVILYNSPSSLLVYWTFNNIFSLIKNMIYYRLDNKRESLENV